MASLKKFMRSQGYLDTKIKFMKSKHILVQACINGVEAPFILDTGASFSCVDFADAPHFHLNTEYSEHKATGAGSTGMSTRIAHDNEICVGNWRQGDHSIMCMDLSHIHDALAEYGAAPVKGIIGSDVLLSGHAVIDYRKKRIYLR